MNKYVVAYWREYTGVLLQEIVEANSRLEAVVSFMGWELYDLENMDEAYRFANDLDSAISVIQINHTKYRPTNEVDIVINQMQ